jgi:hypothetical protein
MTTTAQTNPYPDVLPPAGAVWVRRMGLRGDDRGRYFDHHTIDVGEVSLTIHGVQYMRGALRGAAFCCDWTR